MSKKPITLTIRKHSADRDDRVGPTDRPATTMPTNEFTQDAPETADLTEETMAVLRDDLDYFNSLDPNGAHKYWIITHVARIEKLLLAIEIQRNKERKDGK